MASTAQSTTSHSTPTSNATAGFPYESSTGPAIKSATAAANPIITNALTSSSSITNNPSQNFLGASDLNQIIAATLTGSSAIASSPVTRTITLTPKMTAEAGGGGDGAKIGIATTTITGNNGQAMELNVLTPSSSPSLMGSCNSSSSSDDSQQFMKELKVNEPLRMDCSGGDVTTPKTTEIFLSPNRFINFFTFYFPSMLTV